MHCLKAPPFPEEPSNALFCFLRCGAEAFGDQGIVQTRLPSGELPKAKCQAMLELAALVPARGIAP